MNPKSFVGLCVGSVALILLVSLYEMNVIHNMGQLILLSMSMILGYMSAVMIIYGLNLFGFKTKLDKALKKINREDRL